MKNRIQKICFDGINILFCLSVFAIIISNLIFTTYIANGMNPVLYQNIAVNFILLIFGAVLVIILTVMCNMKSKTLSFFYIEYVIFVMILGAYLLTSFKTAPTSDQAAALYAASDVIFAFDYSPLFEGGYYGMHAHQIGLFTLFSCLEHLFDFKWVQYYFFNFLLIHTGILCFCYAIYKLKNLKTSFYSYLLFSLFLPLHFMPFLIYGEPIVIFLLGLCTVIACSKSTLKNYICVFLLGLCMTMRTSAVVILIALLIMLLLIKPSIKQIGVCCLLLVCFLLPGRFNEKWVNYKYGSDIGGEYSLPTENWISIGLGYSNLFDEPGLYDSSGYDLMVSSNYDKELVKEFSIDKIKNSLNSMKNLAYFWDFFSRKFVITWTDPDFEFMNYVFPNRNYDLSYFYGNNAQVSGIGPEDAQETKLVGELVYTYFYDIRVIEKIFLFGLLSMALFSAVLERKHTFINLFLKLSFFGNVLLYLLIETKPRYVIIAMFILIAYVGLNGLNMLEFAKTIKSRYNNSNSEE